MKAVILAAGLGTRLRPLTDTLPKAMTDIGGKPLLWYHIQLLKHHKLTDIWINLHWLPDKITDYFGDGSQFGVKISYSYEPELLGTAGALKNPHSNITEAISDGDFLVVYSDNLTNFDYTQLINFHLQNNPTMTIGLFKSDEPWTGGVVEIGQTRLVTRLVEKPPKHEVKSNLTNAGIYICSPQVLSYIPPGFSDFGRDIIPKLITDGKTVYGLETDAIVQDIGTFDRLEKAKKLIKIYNLSNDQDK